MNRARIGANTAPNSKLSIYYSRTSYIFAISNIIIISDPKKERRKKEAARNTYTYLSKYM
jgi:predicted SPOUT superfamily RNA methylase MTH1